VQPDVISYSATISACEKGGKWEKALELLSEMENRNVQPDVISYSATISACEKGGKRDKALELLSEMKNRNANPDVISYNATISACQDGDRPDEADALFREAQEANLYSRWEGGLVDFHSYTLSVAKVALRAILRDYPFAPTTGDLQIITGMGNNSEGGAVLKPKLLGFLNTEFIGLNVWVAEDNAGRLVISKDSILGWARTLERC